MIPFPMQKAENFKILYGRRPQKIFADGGLFYAKAARRRNEIAPTGGQIYKDKRRGGELFALRLAFPPVTYSYSKSPCVNAGSAPV